MPGLASYYSSAGPYMQFKMGEEIMTSRSRGMQEGLALRNAMTQQRLSEMKIKEHMAGLAEISEVLKGPPQQVPTTEMISAPTEAIDYENSYQPVPVQRTRPETQAERYGRASEASLAAGGYERGIGLANISTHLDAPRVAEVKAFQQGLMEIVNKGGPDMGRKIRTAMKLFPLGSEGFDPDKMGVMDSPVDNTKVITYPLQNPDGTINPHKMVWIDEDQKQHIIDKGEDKEDKAPTTKSFERGDKHITEFYEGGKLVRTESAPRYKPAGGESPRQTRRDAIMLRKEFSALPQVKEYRTIMTKFGAMEEALAESKVTNNLVATDQALITLFNKMTDPQSVVRESEYARTGVNMPLINVIKGKMEKVMTGGAGLTSKEREAITKMGGMFKNTYQKAYKDAEKEYREYAVMYGIDPDMVLKPLEVSGKPKTRKEYFSAMKKANPSASDGEINTYLDKEGVK